MSFLLSDKLCDCEECAYKKTCDIYYNEKSFRLLEARHEDDWHERPQAEREAQ